MPINCSLVGISTVEDCNANEGGIIKSYATKLSAIASVTLTSGVVSSFTMSGGTGQWEKYEYSLDGTANFNEVSTLTNNRNTVEQTAFMKFPGNNQAYHDAANKAKACCDVVFIHILANGTRVVQGLEYLLATGAPQRTIGRSTRIVPTISSDTTANESRMEWTVAGNANTFTMTTSLTDAAIEAL